MDLFDLAVKNAPSLKERFEELIKLGRPDQPKALKEFALTIASSGRICVNMKQMTLIEFLTFGKYMNIYEWAANRAHLSGRQVTEVIQAKLGRYYEKRLAFDGFFDNSSGFHCGALSVGGLGATWYGDHCAVFNDSVSAGRRDVAYLRSDSVDTYLTEDLDLDKAAIAHDVAPHTHRQFLAAIKHSEQVLAHPTQKWPQLLCNDTEFVEVIFAGDAEASDLEKIRMARSDYEAYFDYGFEDLRGALSDADRYRVSGFVMMLRLLEDRKIPLELVDD